MYAQGQDSLQLKTPEDLGKQVLLAFKTNNLELFRSLLITEPDYDIIINKLEVSDSLKSIYKQDGAGAIRHLNAQAKQNFDAILKQASLNKINWDSTTLKEVQFYSRIKGDVERGDILIFVQAGKINFKLAASNCHKSNRWLIMNKVTFVPMNE